MTGALRIAAIEPYAAVSHLSFLESWRASSSHRIEILSLPARAWKWRMRTSSLHFAREVAQRGPYDAYFVSDYLDLAEFTAHLPADHARAPACVYFHENQLTYPLQPGEARDHHFALQHFHALLVARRALFNSEHHRRTFLAALEELLDHVPDVEWRSRFEEASERSRVVPLGIDLPAREPRDPGGEPPVVLWTHRWEYDKDPDTLANALCELDRRGVGFRLRLLGQRFRELPPAHGRILEELADRVVQDGFLPDRASYLAALASSQIFVSTARHEFFGLGTLEALRFGLHPVLPDDLAYPELLPARLSSDERARFLYRRSDGPVETLERAVDTVVRGQSLALRARLVDATERFTWPVVASELDRIVAELPRRL